MATRVTEDVVAVETSAPVPPAAATPERFARYALPAAGFVAAIALPPLVLDGVWNSTLALAVIFGIMGLSVVLVTGWVGQLSLMPATFVGIGAFAAAGIVTRLATPFWGAIPLAVLVTVPAALMIGMVALRLKGLYLAIMTLVFADVVEQFLFKQEWFTGAGGATPVARPHWLGVNFDSDKSYYVLVVLIASVLLVLTWNFARSRSARACYAVRDNETAAQALGVNVAKYKLIAFALHGMIAGLAGGLYALWIGNVSAGGQIPAFGLQTSLTIVFITILGGVRSIWGPFIGAGIWVVLVQRALAGSPNGQNIAFSIFGIMVLLTMLFRPRGIIGFIEDGARALRRRR